MHDFPAKFNRINCLFTEMEALYHTAALKLNLTDSALFVLYMLHVLGDGCLLSDVCHAGGVSKQTINSALRKLEAEEILYLEHEQGRNKRVRLTAKGREYVAGTGARLYDAECRAFDGWSDDEINQYMILLEKYNASLRDQLEAF